MNDYIDNLISLIQTHKSHIDTLLKIIKQIQKELKLSNISYNHSDYEEMKKINDELIEFIDKLNMEER